MPDWVRTGYFEYIKRLPREITVNLIEINPRSVLMENKLGNCYLRISADSRCSATPIVYCGS